MRHMATFFVITAMFVMAADSARGTTGPGQLIVASGAVAKAPKCPPPPPPPPPRSNRCPCDSQGNLLDKHCGKGNDSNNP
jgi:hypothetical protein